MIISQKKVASNILSKLKKDGGTKEAPVLSEQKMGEPSDLKIIAEDMMMAFKSGSVLDLEQALDALVAKVQSEDEEEDEQEGPDEQEE